MKIIEAMTNNIIQIPKINGRLLPPIISTSLGLKQGDNLSPILLDIFFDDVEEIFADSCNPIKLHNDYQSLALCRSYGNLVIIK